MADELGNIFVLTGVGAVDKSEPFSSPTFEVEAVELASLDPSGRLRWTVQVAGPLNIAAATVRPSVRDGDVWVRLRRTVLRVSAEGQVLWRRDDVPPSTTNELAVGLSWVSSSRAALDRHGTYYVLGMVQAEDGEREELWALSSDGELRWRSAPALPGRYHYADAPPNQTEAPLVGPDGEVFVGCTACVPGQLGLARIDPRTGAPSLLYAEPAHLPDYAYFGDPRWDGSAIWHNLSGSAQGAWKTSLQGFLDKSSPYSLSLASSAGDVWIEQDPNALDHCTVHWGGDVLDIDLLGVVPEGWQSLHARALAVTEPPGLLLALYHDLWNPKRDGADPVLLILVDRKGEVVWQRDDAFAWSTVPVPVIGDGVIVYVENPERRLLAEEAPALRVADGPWPIDGGDPQNTRCVKP